MKTAGLFLVGLIGLVGCGPAPASRIETVRIEGTKVKNQRSVGFCWSYTMTAFIEAIVKRDQGVTVNLSEEALGFYGMALRYKGYTDVFSGSELPAALEGANMQGNWQSDAFDLVKAYGVVPEAQWSFKFGAKNNPGGDNAESIIQKRILAAARGRPAGSLKLEDIFKAMVAEGAYPSRPPTKVRFGDRDITSTEYMRYILRFNPDDYEVVFPDTYEQGISLTKKALAHGVPVPLSFTMFNNVLFGADWIADGRRLNDEEAFAFSGNHAALITDFVNVGGKPGGLSAEAIRAELDKPASALDYLVVKNSWGTESTSVHRMVEEGYYTLDKAYVKANFEKGVFSITLPRNLGAAGREPVDPRVTDTDNISDPGILEEKPYWAVISTGLNCRRGPGKENPVVITLGRESVLRALEIASDTAGDPWFKVMAGVLESSTQHQCYVRAQRSYLAARRIGHLHCPEGAELQMIGNLGGRYCLTSDKKVVGPHPREMVDACKEGGDAGCGDTHWSQKTYLKYRGFDLCPMGTWFDFDTDYCWDGESAFGPFSRELMDRCTARNGGGACSTARWSRNWLIYLQSPEN